MSSMHDEPSGASTLMESMLVTKVDWNTSMVNDSFTNTSTPAWVDETEGGYSVPELIILVSTPLIVVFGTIGNIICTMVLFRTKFRTIGINMYLIALAVADTTFLWTNSTTRSFININFGVDFSTVNTQFCQAYVYLLYSSKCLSAWFTVAVTIERLILVLFPYTARSLCTRKRALIAIGCITFVICGAYSFIPFIYDIRWQNGKGYYKCEMVPYHKENTDVILKTLDLLVYSLMPTVILSVSNSILIYKLVQSAKFRAQTSTTSSEQDQAAWRLTVTLTLVSCCFLIFTVPMSSFLLYAQIHTAVENFSIYYRAFYVLELINSAINFLLYCGSGPTFRKEVKALGRSVFSCRLRKNEKKIPAVVIKIEKGSDDKTNTEKTDHSPASSTRGSRLSYSTDAVWSTNSSFLGDVKEATYQNSPTGDEMTLNGNVKDSIILKITRL